MEQAPTHELSPETERVLGVMEANRSAVWHLGHTIQIEDHFGPVYWNPNYSELFRQAFQSEDIRAVSEAMGGNAGVRGWKELSFQAQLAFDEERCWHVNSHYLRPLEEMSETAKLIGATLAAENIFRRLGYPDIHTHDEALAGLQEACKLDAGTMSRLIRLMAQPFGSEATRSTADRVFRTAVKYPEGLTRQSVSGNDSRIDTDYFGDDSIIERNLVKSFLEVVSNSKPDPSDFETIRAEYPGGSEEILASPAFLASAHQSIRNTIINSHHKNFHPLVLSVMSLEKVQLIAEGAKAGVERYLRDKRDIPGRIGDSSLLEEIGFQPGGRVHYYPHDTLRSIGKTLASLAEQTATA